MVHPGKFTYGGGHVIEDLIAGRQVHLRANGYGTDCYPLTNFEKTITINDLRNATLCNPRNSYQNYNCAVNLSRKTVYTYMGILRPDMGNATYSSAGQLSPLLNDPFYWTIGTGTKIFLGGGVGSVAWNGTQHSPDAKRSDTGMVRDGAGTLTVIGDMKQMNSDYIRGAAITGYGSSLMVGIGIPIPIINRDMAYFTGLTDRDIYCQVVDYGIDYPSAENRSLAEVTYADLKSGEIEVMGRKVPASPLSSYPVARRIAETLKEWVQNGFTVGVPQMTLPSVPFAGRNNETE